MRMARNLGLTTALAVATAYPAVASATDAAPATAENEAVVAMPQNGLAIGMAGTWSGRGTVLPSFEQEKPFRVKCEFDVSGDESSVSLDGECGALFVKRKVAVALTEGENGITGTYDAALRTGIAELSGTKEGNTIDLEVNWGGEVNGDTEGTMVIERTGENALRIVFRDVNPASGEEEVTTQFELTRG